MLSTLMGIRTEYGDPNSVNDGTSDDRLTADAELAISNAAAASLYRQAPVALAVCAAVAVAMTLAIDFSYTGKAPWVWLGIAMLVFGFRLFDAARWRTAQSVPHSYVLIRSYTAGVIASALLWAVLPFVAFANLDMAGKAIVTLATAGTVSASALWLSPLRRVSLWQAGLLLLPGSAWLVLSASYAERILGMFGILFFAVAGVGITLAHRALRSTMLIEQDNRRLAKAEEATRLHSAQLVSELAEARVAMEQAQLGMQRRIEDRTAALEDRSKELARQALTDPLTGLPNRKGINEHLSLLLSNRTQPQMSGQLALLFLDLDHFKEVNDLMGHLAGDAVLRVAAERIRETIPRHSFAARWGGDEFVVVLPNLQRPEAQSKVIAEQVRAALSVPVRLEERVVRIGCSIGIALAPAHGNTPEALVTAADHAVYSAKADGNGIVRMYDSQLAEEAGRQNRIAQALPAAVELGQLQVAYQPIVDHEGVATHAEALARWWHPQWGAVSPAEFIPVAEASGLIHTMGRWVLRQACIDAARWPGSNPPKVSVNVSAMQVSSGRLVAQVREALASAGLPPQRLMIELTESMPMGGRDRVEATLAELRHMGVTLAIDDFGTGYSSLSSLMRLPLKLVKVDRSFVRDVPGEGELLIKATIDVARCFGLEVVAEGVETRAQKNRLMALGVTYMQGYLFGRPMPNADFTAWLGLRDDSDNVVVLRA
jgi:diguanylate cyclase (GGDEF)-like protein